ncbi:cupin domain-containing protein [Mycoplasmatota bacterium]|nr:cupin domain-containing protein [Mycoplasmatota bacterium]
MVVNNINNLKAKKIEHESAQNAYMKVLVSEKEGWDDYVMRVVEVEEGGFTPKHKHPWPHINYVIEGQGSIMMNGKDYPVQSGSYAYVPSNTMHQYKNTSDKIFKFICIVPKEGHR